MSLVAGDTCADKRTMMDFASRSHAPDVQSRMCRELQGAFFDERRRPDEPRCRAGADMLVAMADRVPESFSVQPLAVLGVCDVVDGRQSSGGVRVALPDAG